MGITLLYATCPAGGTGCVTDIGSDGASAMRINENNCLGSIGSTVRKTVRTPPAVGPSGLTFAA